MWTRDGMSAKGQKQKNKEPKGQLDAFRRLCRRAGLKITPQRIAVYKALMSSKQHPPAEKIYRSVRKVLPNISLDTVNRTLITFTQVGAALIVEGSGEPKRFDANMQTHQHFKCVKCRKIFDLHYKPFDNIKLPHGIAKKFTVLRKTVYLEGLCNRCRN